jgi:hypothetical protein
MDKIKNTWLWAVIGIGFVIVLVLTIALANVVQERNELKNPPADSQADSKTIYDAASTTTVYARYPVTGNAAVDGDIEAMVNKQISDFKAAIPTSTPEGVSWKYDIYIQYVSSQFSNTVRSFRFLVSEFTGGAHPNTIVVTKTYDMAAGKELVLADFFKPGTDYVGMLSRYAISDIKGRSINPDAKWVAEGAGPDPENFRSFTASEEGLTIYFDPYQVAPYSAGVQEIRVYYSFLKDYLREPYSDAVLPSSAS